MKKKFGPAFLLGAMLLALSGPSFAARGYEAYYDMVNDSPWFDGARATIEYQQTTVDAIAVAVWCGIDNGGVGGWSWFQGGWHRVKDGKPEIYWEYKDKDGGYGRGFDQAPGNSETYEQSRFGSDVIWSHDDVVYKMVAWSKFSDVEFRKVQYGAEMLDSPGDHTPGKADSKNKFTASMARRAGNGFAVTGLNHVVSTAQQGNVEKYGAEDSGNFRTWDSRND